MHPLGFGCRRRRRGSLAHHAAPTLSLCHPAWGFWPQEEEASAKRAANQPPSISLPVNQALPVVLPIRQGSTYRLCAAGQVRAPAATFEGPNPTATLAPGRPCTAAAQLCKSLALGQFGGRWAHGCPGRAPLRPHRSNAAQRGLALAQARLRGDGGVRACVRGARLAVRRSPRGPAPASWGPWPLTRRTATSRRRCWRARRRRASSSAPVEVRQALGSFRLLLASGLGWRALRLLCLSAAREAALVVEFLARRDLTRRAPPGAKVGPGRGVQDQHVAARRHRHPAGLHGGGRAARRRQGVRS